MLKLEMLQVCKREHLERLAKYLKIKFDSTTQTDLLALRIFNLIGWTYKGYGYY